MSVFCVSEKGKQKLVKRHQQHAEMISACCFFLLFNRQKDLIFDPDVGRSWRVLLSLSNDRFVYFSSRGTQTMQLVYMRMMISKMSREQ